MAKRFDQVCAILHVAASSHITVLPTVMLTFLQDESTTVGVFFEIMTSKKHDSGSLDGSAGQTFYLQFKTQYLNGQTGRLHCRVTTVTRQ